MKLEEVRAAMARTDLTPREADDISTTGWWNEVKPAEAARMQLQQELLCLPRSLYVTALYVLLNRLVTMDELQYPHVLLEEANNRLRQGVG